MKKQNIISTLIILAVVFGVLALIASPYLTARTVEFTATGRERVVSGSREHVSSKYLVFTEIETFENVDCWRWLKFNSSDVQGRIVAGRKYRARVYGWRIPLVSQYRNIVTAEEVKP